MKIKRIICFLAFMLSICLFSGVAFADELPENGWYKTDSTYVASDAKEYPAWQYYINGEAFGDGLLEIDGKYYYFTDGPYDPPVMCRDFEKDDYYFGFDGKRVSNYWREILNLEFKYEIVGGAGGPNPDIVAGYVSESYDPRRWEYYGANGKRTYGWAWIGGDLYNFDNAGVLQTGWFEDDSGKYYLTEYGAKTSQWLKDEETGQWRYFKANGPLATDEWVLVKNKWYLFDENGIMLTGAQERNGKSYLLSDSGAMYTGWKKTDDGQWIYYKADGPMAKDEWVMVKTQWYLFDENGIMRTGLLDRYDHTYYFSDSGSMATGWKKLDGVWYYFRPAQNANGPQGSMVKDSWVLSGNKWYYMGSDGVMVTGTKDIYSGNYGKSDEYYFSDSGAMQTGWHHVNGNWHFYRTSSSANGPQGSMAKGVWVPAGSFWYFTDHTDGAMVLGWKDIEGDRYYFSDDASHYGQMVTGKQVIDGKEYTFDDDGALVK